MIAPLRISLGGGGIDVASYHLIHGEFVISAATRAMIAAGSPLRVSAGDGTDLPSYYLERGEFVISTPSNRNVPVATREIFRPVCGIRAR